MLQYNYKAGPSPKDKYDFLQQIALDYIERYAGRFTDQLHGMGITGEENIHKHMDGIYHGVLSMFFDISAGNIKIEHDKIFTKDNRDSP